MPREVAEVNTDEEALTQVCGGLAMAERVKALWADMLEKKRLDVSNQRLTDADVHSLLKGLHMCADRLPPDAARAHHHRQRADALCAPPHRVGRVHAAA